VLSSSRDGRPFGHNRHGPKIGGNCTPFGEELGLHQRQCGPAEAYLHTKWHLDPSSRLATIDGPKSGGGLLCPLFGGSWSQSNTMSPGPRPTSLPSGVLVHPAVWPQQTWVENWEEGLCPFGGEGAGSPSNTIWPGLRPTSIPSFTLIHPTVWPQYTNVIEQDRQD